MTNNKTNSAVFLFIGLLLGGLIMYFFNHYKIEKKAPEAPYTDTAPAKPDEGQRGWERSSAVPEGADVSKLTDEATVISYVKAHQQLPAYYITKSEARKAGWEPAEGNLCDVLPGRAIGGDRFGNREKTLPAGQQYYEADVNYSCGRRGADRIVYTPDGDVWLTHDHYKSFQKQ